jgi:hypothetical protein
VAHVVDSRWTQLVLAVGATIICVAGQWPCAAGSCGALFRTFWCEVKSTLQDSRPRCLAANRADPPAWGIL